MKEKQRADARKFEAQLQQTPVAIIGMASIFPGAHNLEKYWENILGKIDCITDVPSDRWKIEDYYDPDPSTPDKVYSKRGGFIPDIDFDPMEFGLPPNILEVTDVAQLLALVVARDALRDAGYGDGVTFDRDETGVILGVVGMGMKLLIPLTARLQDPVWRKVLKKAGLPDKDIEIVVQKFKSAYVNWDTNAFPGTIANVVAGRIANRFDLGGTNCVVDAACASSLAAIKMAVGELVEGRANMMITGGVDTDNSIGAYMCFSKTPAFTSGDKVRTFDEKSDGMMVGEGLGMVILKRLEDAERDGDRIYAVLKGIGSSSDGRFKSIYAPRSTGQAKALDRAYQEAGFSPSSVGLIDAHGTGTMAGDPAEMGGLKAVFGESNPGKGYIALGSVKSQIAHTKAAAGVASLIKSTMALHHKVLPATINVDKPNPSFELEKSPFYINTETRPWFRLTPDTPRRAGVSSFGFGGTNYHVVLEEYQKEHEKPYRVHDLYQTIILDAESREKLVEECEKILIQIESGKAVQYYNQLVQESRGRQIPENHVRVGFVAGSLEEAKSILKTTLDMLKNKDEDAWEHPKGIYFRKSAFDPQGKVVALFPGQGSQYLDMGRELAITHPAFREAYTKMDEKFLEDHGRRLTEIVYPAPAFEESARKVQEKELTSTENAQPAIGAFSFGVYDILKGAGFKPDMVAGHSFGELTALWAAGVLDDESYLKLAHARGKAMAAPQEEDHDSGTMLAVKGNVEQITKDLESLSGVTIANLNSNEQVVLAGSKADIEQANQHFSKNGYRAVILPVSAAFHTPLVKHAWEPFSNAVNNVTFKKPKVKVYSNSTGKAYSKEPEEIQEALADHILNPVYFLQEIESIYNDGGRIFVEFGPKNVLTNLVSSILNGKSHIAIAINPNNKKDSDLQFRQAVVQMRVAGLKIEDVDPFLLEKKVETEKKQSGVSVKLNGGLYISEKTRKGFEEALSDGYQLPLDSSQFEETIMTEKQGETTTNPPEQGMTEKHQTERPGTVPIGTNESPVVESHSINGLGNVLEKFQEHQKETTQVHSQYLKNEAEFARIFSQMMQAKLNLVTGENRSQQELEQIKLVLHSIDNSLQLFQNHQAETLQIHERYLQEQAAFSRQFAQLFQDQSLKVGVSVPVKESQPKASGIPPVESKAEKPEYTPVVSYGKPASTSITQPVEEKPAQPVEKPVEDAKHRIAAAPGIENVTNAFLEIVSEKTGYPVETLDLDMDLEADLGIDSIKRVEILGGLQERFPEMPQPDPEELAELRTLQEIIDYMTATGGEKAHEVNAPAADIQVQQQEFVEVNSAQGTASQKIVALDDLTDAFIEIVSDKTGYPPETLDLDMDLEADLGIDSIKRVEILGALQERFPEMPQPDTNALSEQRTLKEIIDYMVSMADEVQDLPSAVENEITETTLVEKTPDQMQSAAAGSVDLESLSAAFFEVVSEKTGYPVETLEAEMDIEADLGIDSIKRVEILGAIQDRFPNLPQPDTETLAEKRTIAEFVNYLSQPGELLVEQTPGEEVSEVKPWKENSVPVNTVEPVRLPQPDSIVFSMPDGYICLVTDDGTGVTAELAVQMEQKGFNVVVVRLPETVYSAESTHSDQLKSVQLASFEEDALADVITGIEDQYGKPAAFIHLDPPELPGKKGNGHFQETRKKILQQVFLMAKYLQPLMKDAAKETRAAFMTVTRMDGGLGLQGEDSYDPISGGYTGLVKTLNLEWPQVFCRSVDLNPDISIEDAVEKILAEFHDPNRLVTEVAYDRVGRTTLAVESTEN